MPKFNVLRVALATIALAAAPANAVTLTENFDVDFAGWKSRWFGANSNARPLNQFNLADRGTNQTGLSLFDGDFGPDGQFNSTATNIQFNAAFAASLTSLSFDLLSYNDQPLIVYDKDGTTIFQTQLPTTPFDPNNFFPQSAYTSYSVSSTNGIGGFRFGPFGSDLNIGIDNLVAVTAAIPEPATWAMMIGGFGLIGGAMRRRVARPAFA